jgi:hypothetical protein
VPFPDVTAPVRRPWPIPCEARFPMPTSAA